MNVWDAIVTQRAVRSFSDRPISEEALDQILEAGRRAPSSKNTQPWAFIVVRDRARLEELSAIGDFAGHLAGAAAAIAFITDAKADGSASSKELYDLGHATQNMMLCALALGIGSVHAAVYDQELTRRILGYPDAKRCDFLISLGYPAREGLLDRPRRKVPRRPLDEVVHHERW